MHKLDPESEKRIDRKNSTCFCCRLALESRKDFPRSMQVMSVVLPRDHSAVDQACRELGTCATMRCRILVSRRMRNVRRGGVEAKQSKGYCGYSKFAFLNTSLVNSVVVGQLKIFVIAYTNHLHAESMFNRRYARKKASLLKPFLGHMKPLVDSLTLLLQRVRFKHSQIRLHAWREAWKHRVTRAKFAHIALFVNVCAHRRRDPLRASLILDTCV